MSERDGSCATKLRILTLSLSVWSKCSPFLDARQFIVVLTNMLTCMYDGPCSRKSVHWTLCNTDVNGAIPLRPIGPHGV
jgi:hypothetical protein